MYKLVNVSFYSAVVLLYPARNLAAEIILLFVLALLDAVRIFLGEGSLIPRPSHVFKCTLSIVWAGKNVHFQDVQIMPEMVADT